MCPISYEDAYNATNPADNETKRSDSARAIMAGVAANDVYWDSRPELEALRAQAEGHGVVVRGPDEAEEDPVTVGSAVEVKAIEAESTEEGVTTSLSKTGGDLLPTPDNPVNAVARLRSQLEAAGITPEA